MGRLLLAVGAVLAAGLLLPGAARADTTGPEHQLTFTGPPGDARFAGAWSDVATSPLTGEALVVFVADLDATRTTGRVFVQRVAPDGTRIGGRIQVSDDGIEIPPSEYNPASIVYAPERNEFLATWNREDDAVFAQRLDGFGNPIGSDIPVGSGYTDIETTEAVFNGRFNKWFVAFKGVKAPSGEEVYGQFINPSGSKFGANFTVSDFTDHADDAIGLAVAPDSGRMLAVVRGEEPPVQNESEVYGFLMDHTGGPIGDRIRVSDMGPDGSTLFAAQPPFAAWDPVSRRWLVVWSGDDNVGGALADHRDVFSQLLDADGNEIGQNDRRLTNAGPPGDIEYQASRPALAFNPFTNEWLMVWHEGYQNDDGQIEIFGRRLNLDGIPLSDPLQLADITPNGDEDLGNTRPFTAYSPATCDWWVVYQHGDKNVAPGTPHVGTEIMGRRYLTAGCPVPPAPPAGAGGGATGVAQSVNPAVLLPPQVARLLLRVQSRQRFARTGVLTLRVGCDAACTIVLRTTVNVPGAARVFRLGTRTVRLRQAGNRTVRVRLSRRARRAARRGLRRNRRVVARVRITKTDTLTGRVSRTSRRIVARR